MCTMHTIYSVQNVCALFFGVWAHMYIVYITYTAVIGWCVWMWVNEELKTKTSYKVEYNTGRELKNEKDSDEVDREKRSH